MTVDSFVVRQADLLNGDRLSLKVSFIIFNTNSIEGVC